jgi:hypothetical protein
MLQRLIDLLAPPLFGLLREQPRLARLCLVPPGGRHR